MRKINAVFQLFMLRVGPFLSATLILGLLKVLGVWDLPWILVLAPALFRLSLLLMVIGLGAVFLLFSHIVANLGQQHRFAYVLLNMEKVQIWAEGKLNSYNEKVKFYQSVLKE